MKDVFDVARILLETHNKINGANLNVYTGESIDPLRGVYIVGGGKASFIVPRHQITPMDALTHIWNIRKRCEEESDDTLVAGAWWDGGRTHLDECICIVDKDKALDLAMRRGEKYILENKTGLILAVPEGSMKVKI